MFLTQALDRWVMNRAGPSVAANPPGPPRIDEALALIRDPQFLHPPMPSPQLEFDGDTFRFPSAFPSPWPETNVVHGRLSRLDAEWKRGPTVLLIHGWNGELGYRYLFPGWARRLKRAGMNAAMLELPYHGLRKPIPSSATRNFLSPDLVRVAEATRQSVADIRAIIGWLKDQGAPVVMLWGVSLGAWLAGLILCADDRVSGAVLMTPVGRMDRAIRELSFSEPIRRNVGPNPLDLSRLNLISHSPRLAAENILLVGSRYDLFAPMETVEELQRAWPGSGLWLFPHGHISLLLSPSVIGRTVAWLAALGTKCMGRTPGTGQ